MDSALRSSYSNQVTVRSYILLTISVYTLHTHFVLTPLLLYCCYLLSKSELLLC